MYSKTNPNFKILFWQLSLYNISLNWTAQVLINLGQFALFYINRLSISLVLVLATLYLGHIDTISYILQIAGNLSNFGR